ncbi:MAG: hypothetical protein DRI44_03055 [Chlamydiae bacterium]|nr:MAG: hypothetical protein DRI44_03055 [Chlamydiota bacterium]
MSQTTDINAVVRKAKAAAAIFGQLSQKHVDKIVYEVCKAGFDNRIKLAKLAVEETQLGKWEDKVIKNVVATQYIYEDIKNEKTVGIISENKKTGIIEIAEPIGPIFAITPVTNPTSTVLFKILIALKSRNPIIIRPHTKALNCSGKTAQICYEAAIKADAPDECIQWLGRTTRDETHELMAHKDLSLILATGGGSLVRAAYSSGTPAIGVGAGNVPALIEKSADIPFAVEQIFISKTFDNGTVCASEQSIIVEESVAKNTIKEMISRGAYFLSPEEIKKVEKIAYNKERGIMNADIIGQPAEKIAEIAGVNVPVGTKLLVAPLDGVGDEYPLSSEILAPIIAFYEAEDFDTAVNICIDLNFYGGTGHTASIFSNNNEKIKDFAQLMDAGRIVVNTPSSQGGVGGMYNTLHTSFTLGCGTRGNNSTTDNITATHLLNIQRIAKRRDNERFVRFDSAKYFDEALDFNILEREFNLNY